MADAAHDEAMTRFLAKADQARAALREAMVLGLARSLAGRLVDLDWSAGPWLLHADGRLERLRPCGTPEHRHYHPIPTTTEPEEGSTDEP